MSVDVETLIVVITVGIVLILLIPRLVRARREPIRFPTRKTPSPPSGFPTPAERSQTEAEIAARNAHVYKIADIPPELDRLTLFRFYHEFRAEAVAGAYLYPGIRSQDDCNGRTAPAPYYRYRGSIWSWDGDSYGAENPALQREAKARFDQMLALLHQSGWQGGTPYDEQVWLLHLYRPQ